MLLSGCCRLLLQRRCLITCSADGIALFYPKGQQQRHAGHYFPVKMRQLRDVTGAGDTVLAVLALALAMA